LGSDSGQPDRYAFFIPGRKRRFAAALRAGDGETLDAAGGADSGKGNAEMAAALYLSTKTVKNSVTRILKKLQLRNRIEAAVYAARHGLAE
jgi:hypothetical protein